MRVGKETKRSDSNSAGLDVIGVRCGSAHQWDSKEDNLKVNWQTNSAMGVEKCEDNWCSGPGDRSGTASLCDSGDMRGQGDLCGPINGEQGGSSKASSTTPGSPVNGCCAPSPTGIGILKVRVDGSVCDVTTGLDNPGGDCSAVAGNWDKGQKQFDLGSRIGSEKGDNEERSDKVAGKMPCDNVLVEAAIDTDAKVSSRGKAFFDTMSRSRMAKARSNGVSLSDLGKGRQLKDYAVVAVRSNVGDFETREESLKKGFSFGQSDEVENPKVFDPGG